MRIDAGIRYALYLAITRDDSVIYPSIRGMIYYCTHERDESRFLTRPLVFPADARYLSDLNGSL